MTAARSWHDPSTVLAGDSLVDPPADDYGYFNTPLNSLTFLAMGVDGVHTAMLKLDGAVREDSPVLQVAPMDGDREWTILAASFLDFLADGCAVSRQTISERIDRVDSDPAALMGFLRDNFERSRLLGEERSRKLNAEFLGLVEKKQEYRDMEARWSRGEFDV